MHCRDGLFYVLPLMPQSMCSQFWPTEEIHSSEYGQLVVTFASTTTKPDWEMTILQVSDKNRVSLVKFFHFKRTDCQGFNTLKWHYHSPSQSSSTSLNVTLFHFLSWPREGRPPIDSMLKMMGEVEKKQKDIKAPLMVMCEWVSKMCVRLYKCSLACTGAYKIIILLLFILW